MRFNFYPPSAPLQAFVQGYMEADSTGIKDREEHTLFPNGYPGIFFNFGVMGKLSISALDGAQTARVSVFGQIDRSFTAVHWPGSYCLGVIFKPAGLARFLRMPVHEFTNQAQDATLMVKALNDLHEQLEACTTTPQKVTRLDAYFTASLLRHSQSAGIAEKAIQLIDQNSITSVEAVAASLGITTRHLEIQFKRHVGLSPKTYAMILRFKRMQRLLQNAGNVPWKQMDFAGEYYDQNHFIKEFKRFTGHTPLAYMQNTFELGNSYLIH
jgi:AraC-like DNA-binding protein